VGTKGIDMIESTEKRIAVVTGGGEGIGRTIALTLAEAGFTVTVSDIDISRAEKVAAEIENLYGEAFPLEMNVTRKREIEKAIDKIVSHFGRLDIWCNNAGVSSMNHFLELSEEEWDNNMDVNAKGTFLCSQAAAKFMATQLSDPERHIRGKIINIASMAGKRGNAPFLAHYVASKFAVVGLTQAMASEMAEHLITVNAVCPGYVRTAMQKREVTWEAKLRGLNGEDIERLYIEDTPLARLQTPDDVAGVVLFLSSTAADFITGESINVNGGSWMD
jgi:meso-butanediol dehydrogenase/(S,S)-butanediol dehydrogenase/diacetyl reductase